MKKNYVARQGTEKKVPNSKTGAMNSTNKKEISPKFKSGTGASKDPSNTNQPSKQSSVSQKPHLGGQQGRVSRQVKAGYNQVSIKSDTKQIKDLKIKDKIHREPSPPVPALRKKTAATLKPQMEPMMNRSPRGMSPPVPAVRRKLQGARQEIDKVPQNDFIPFTRTSDVLDPANADSPMPISREQSSVVRGRESYWKGQQPASFGDSVEHFIDQPMSDHEKPSVKSTLGEASLSEKKALFQELSALKQKLRQLELETSTSMLEPQLTP